jgi:iron complex outermembrane receptor protein
VKIDYKIDYANTDYTQPLYQIAGFTGVAPFSSNLGGSILSPISRISDAPRRMSQAATDLNGLNTIRTFGQNVTAQVVLDTGLTLKTIFGYRRLGTFSISDLDGSDLVATGPPPTPYTLVSQIALRRQNQFSGELQLIGKNADVDWILGAFFYREHTFEQPITFGYAELGPGRTYITTTADYGATNSYSRAGDRSLALYGHGAWHLSERLDVAGGLRFSADRKGMTLLGDCLFPNPALGDPVAAQSRVEERFDYCVPNATSVPGPRSNSATRNYASLDWDASLTYTFAPDAKAYFRGASGFQSGGFLNFYDFLPERMISLEIGLKSDLLVHRLRVDGAIFVTHRHNAQQAAYYGPNVGSHIDNLQLDTRGGEIELTAVPTRRLTLGLGGGFTRVDAANGERQAVPKWTLLGQIQYDFPRGPSGAYPFFRFDGSWTSRITPVTSVPTYPGTTSVFGGTVDQALTVPAQMTVNGRIGMADLPVGGTKAHLAVWAKNLFDDASINFGSDFITVALITYKPPRTIGIDFGMDF